MEEKKEEVEAECNRFFQQGLREAEQEAQGMVKKAEREAEELWSRLQAKIEAASLRVLHRIYPDLPGDEAR